MSHVNADADFLGNFYENSTQFRDQEQNKDNVFKTVQLVDELTALYKNEQEEKISMAPEHAEDSTTNFRFKSETGAEKEKQEMLNKLVKTGGILILGALLLNFVLVVIVMNRTSELSSSLSASTSHFSAWEHQMNETAQIVGDMKYEVERIPAVVNLTNRIGHAVDEMKFELTGFENWINSTEEKFESHHLQIQSLLNQTKIDKQLKALEKELKESHEELMERFELLSQKFDELESNVSLMTPPPENQDPEPIDPESLQNCRDVTRIFPPPRSEKQWIHPHGNSTKVQVLCDFETDGGGWTIIQKRSSGPKKEFNRTWAEYSRGFGSLNGNFWLGLENIRALTQNGDQELRIELEDFEGEKRWAKYSSFSISDASDFYRLSISGYSGDAGNNMIHSISDKVHNGMQFSTPDKDNDKSPGNCAVSFPGGWWFNACFRANLNGLYFEKGETVPDWEGIIWHTWKGENYSLAKTEMKIRTKKS